MVRADRHGLELTLDTVNLRELFPTVKEFSPRLLRELRRVLRRVGDPVIAEQRAILNGPLPKGVAVVGHRLQRIRARGSKRAYTRVVNRYGDVDRPNAGQYSRGLRQKISAGLKTRVVAGKSRQGISLKTTGPRLGGYNMAKVYSQKRFRHPVYAGSDGEVRWVYQGGMPYFWDPILNGGRERMRNRASDAIDRTLAAMSGGKK